MLPRTDYRHQVENATSRAPITALVGPRQCGKTELARQIAATRKSTLFDLASKQDMRRLANPELALGRLDGLVVLDEIERMPWLFDTLEVLADRADRRSHHLVLGSADPDLVRGVPESLAGRIECIELSGFDLSEIGTDAWRTLWLRGGFPQSFLAVSDIDSRAWRDRFIRRLLKRDIPRLGIVMSAADLRRFWMTLAHWHGRTWNAVAIGRTVFRSDKTVRRYLDLLTGAYMVRQLQPWFETVARRQVTAPRIYLRDSGLLHALLDIHDYDELLAHSSVDASWKGFVIEQILRTLQPPTAWHWAAEGSGALDLLIVDKGRRIGFDLKFGESPYVTGAMDHIVRLLSLEHLFEVCATGDARRVDARISVVPVRDLSGLRQRIDEL